ncbi:MAG TPA: DUF1549 domain-containing protein, partial [Pirellulaceae bacterium]|nr:DUF1549 domain-containing protein [Pirellulaceae bacterium]
MPSRIRTAGNSRRLTFVLLCFTAAIESATGVASSWVTGDAAGWTPSRAAAADSDETLFESKIRPLLVERCHKCHAGDVMKGGLKLDARDAALKGGETGPAFVPGKPDESLLLQAVRHQNGLAMPPDGKLKDAEIAALTDWIKRGAKWPGAATVAPTPPPAASTIAAAAPNSGDLQPALQLWLASDSLGLNDGEPVFVWPDRSGHGRDVTATRGVRTGGVGGPGKFIKQSSLLGRPAVRFDTATGFAGSPDNLIPLRGDAPVTIMVVMNLQPHDAQPPYDGVIGVGNPAHPGDPGRPLAALVQINRGEDHALHFAGGWNHDASLGVGSFKPHYGKPVMLTVVKQPGPMRSTTRLFLNGSPALRGGDQPLEGRDGVPDFQHRADIGAYLGKALAWCGSIQGDVGEVLIYNQALGDSQRAAVENHLSEKYGLWLNQAGNRAAPPVFSPEEKSFWAYQVVREPPLPTIPPLPTLPKVEPMSKAAKASYEQWLKSPVDRFVLQKLDERRLAPAPQADKLTLLRRATFDLTGLPPSSEEVEAFVADDSPQAFEKVVNRLLDSPHYGERWGRHWLDVVRYAESTANDANAVMRFAWRYRNYVIDAFNRDLPYDQFLIEQLAGDLLPATDDVDMTTRRIIATGFLMVGPKALAETDKEQSRLDIVDDQIDVTGRAMLGLTLACARCHDHKFDAIRATDYYALAGIFRSTEPFQDENRNATMWWEFPVPQGAGKEPIVVMAPKESAPRNLRVHLRGNRFTLGAAVPRGFLQVIEQVANRGPAQPSSAGKEPIVVMAPKESAPR